MEMVHVLSLHHLHIQHAAIASFGSSLTVDIRNPVILIGFMVILWMLAYIKVLLRNTAKGGGKDMYGKKLCTFTHTL